MPVVVYRRNVCRLCGSGDLILALSLAPTPLADDYTSAARLQETQPTYPLDLYLCRDCGFSQLLDVVSPENVYYDYIYETKSSLGLVDHFNLYADEVLAKINPPAAALVVDIGSNDGTLLKAFKNQGLRVLGVDPAREIARRSTESGIETLPEFFTTELAEQIRERYGPSTIITANNIYANVDDLNSLTIGIRSLLSSDGVFVFESFYLAEQIKNMVFDFTYHEHLSYFSVKPLVSFFKNNGMELIDIKPIPTKGGSLRYTVQLAGGPRATEPSVAEFMAREAEQGIHEIGAFRDFEKRICAAKDRTLGLLRDLAGKKKVIAGFGASATSTTLIYHFELENILSCIYDDYEAKQNLFSPGAHIPVLSPKDMFNKGPDYIVVLAWRYYKPIIEKYKSFLDEGGHFIVPLPSLQVI